MIAYPLSLDGPRIPRGLGGSSSKVQLALAEDLLGPFRSAPWIGSLVALGSRASRYALKHPSRQLVLTVSVPQRDFAAVLLGCGWMLMSHVSDLPEPLGVLQSLKPGTPVRVVMQNCVIADVFSGLDETHGRLRMLLEIGRAHV